MVNKHDMRQELTLFLVVGAASALQAFGFSFGGVTPNLALACLVAAAFVVRDLYEGIALVAVAALILKAAPGFDIALLGFFLVGSGIMILAPHLPGEPLGSAFLLSAIGTLSLYAVFVPSLAFSWVAFRELFLNLAATCLFFVSFRVLWHNKMASHSL